MPEIVFVLACTHAAALIFGAAIAAFIGGQSYKAAINDTEHARETAAYWRGEANANALKVATLTAQIEDLRRKAVA